MSISEFSSALKNKAIKEWFTSEKMYGKEINNLINATSEYRSAEQTAEKTAFIITKDTVKSLLIDLKGITSEGELDLETERIFKLFGSKNTGVKVNRKKIKVGPDMPAIYFAAISFDSITNLINNILELDPGELATRYEKGHVIGLNTELLRVTSNRIMNEIDGRTAQGAIQAKNVILGELEKVINYYKKLDYDSANIQPASDVPVYASVNKTLSKSGKTKYLVELQSKAQNQRSADEVKATIGSIRKLFSPGALTEKQMVATIDKLRKSVSDPKFAGELLNLRSSPSFIDMLAKNIADTLRGKPSNQAYSVPKVEIGKQKVPKINLKELQLAVRAEQKKVEAIAAKLKKSVPKIKPPKTVNLVSLLNIINSQLQDVISANMGDGSSRNVLNYRTGRFASSAKVERLTQGRDGMISAFYTYMQNPYATFSEGGRQSRPASRDPKLLISRSIREIAATQVTNRLRAVLA
jgi:hypothetical protein